MSEETRAIEYRRMMTARSQWEYDQRFIAHPSNRAAILAFREKWRPVLDTDREWDPPDDCRDLGKGLQIL
jgi:hypothetical protein